MRPGKLMAVAVLGFLAWEHQEALAPHTGMLRELGPLVMTYAEMRQYRPALMAEMNRGGGQPPRDAARFLDGRFNRGTRRASQDLWGSSYRVERGEFRRWYLRSCGPDRQCRTEDDLVAPLFDATSSSRP